MLSRQRSQVIGKACTVIVSTVALQMVTTIPIELGGGAIQSQSDVLSQRITRIGHRLANDFQRCRVGGQVGRKATLVPDGCGEPSTRKHFFQVMENLGAHAQRLGKITRRDGLNHELLNIHIVIGVLSPVQDIHHRHGQRQSRAARELCNVLIKRFFG